MAWSRERYIRECWQRNVDYIKGIEMTNCSMIPLDGTELKIEIDFSKNSAFLPSFEGNILLKEKFRIVGPHWFSEQYEFKGILADYKKTENNGETTTSLSLTPAPGTVKRVTNDSVLAKILRKIYNGRF